MVSNNLTQRWKETMQNVSVCTYFPERKKFSTTELLMMDKIKNHLRSVIRDNLLNYRPTELLVEDFVHQHYVKVCVGVHIFLVKVLRRRGAWLRKQCSIPQSTSNSSPSPEHSVWRPQIQDSSHFPRQFLGVFSGIFKDAHVFVKSTYSLWHFGSSLIWLLPCKDSESTRLVQRLSNTRCLVNLVRTTRFSSYQLITTARQAKLKQNRKLPVKKILQQLWQMSFKKTLSHATCYCTA